MLKNYIKVAWRHYVRDKSISFINTIGLSVAIAAFFMIAMFIYDEWSYDRYHDDADQLYRITKYFERGDRSSATLATANILAPTLQSEVPGIQNVLRINTTFQGEVIVESDENKFVESRFLFADPSILEFFSYQVLEGDPDSMLERPFTVVITESTAEKYFGRTDVVGKTLSIETWGVHDYEVSGVIEDLPSNTHLHFDILASNKSFAAVVPNGNMRLESWQALGAYTYVKLDEGVSPEEVENKFKDILDKYLGEQAQFISMNLQPVTDIHLYSDFDRELRPNSDIRYIYIFGSVAFLILVIAGINYINLTTAKSLRRSMEVGVRKAVGGSRTQIMVQFFTEAVLTCLVSVGSAILFVEIFLPYINNITGKSLEVPYGSLLFWGVIVSFLLVFNIASGFYPSFYLSRLKPSGIFNQESHSPKKSFFRSGLIVFQFSISVFLIIGTFVIEEQLNFIQTKNLGVDSSQIVLVEAHGLGDNYNAFQEELYRVPGINSVSYSPNKVPVTQRIERFLYPNGQPSGYNNMLSIGPDFLETMGIDLVDGNDLTRYSSAADMSYQPVLINETAVKEFGWSENPIGKTLEGSSNDVRVVGVVSDFHYEPVKSRIEPLILARSEPERSDYIFINTETSDIRSAIAGIEEVWNETGTGTPLTYSFLDDAYQNLYLAEDRLASIFNYFSVLAIAITCFGLFGLTIFSAERRTKEIGIRKVLGASITNIVTLLSKDFILLVSIGFLIAVPIAWYSMSQWLADFAYRIEIGPGIFVMGGVAALVIAMLTVSWQSIKAATANPVDSLRSE
jgi:putative ABC transport system permease protein